MNRNKWDRLMATAKAADQSVERIARNDLAWRIAGDFYGQPDSSDRLAEAMGEYHTDLGETVENYAEAILLEADTHAPAPTGDEQGPRCWWIRQIGDEWYVRNPDRKGHRMIGPLVDEAEATAVRNALERCVARRGEG